MVPVIATKMMKRIRIIINLTSSLKISTCNSTTSISTWSTMVHWSRTSSSHERSHTIMTKHSTIPMLSRKIIIPLPTRNQEPLSLQQGRKKADSYNNKVPRKQIWVLCISLSLTYQIKPQVKLAQNNWITQVAVLLSKNETVMPCFFYQIPSIKRTFQLMWYRKIWHRQSIAKKSSLIKVRKLKVGRIPQKRLKI